MYELSEMNPRLHLTSEELPEINFWEDGKEYDVDVKLKMISVTKVAGSKTRAEFEVMTITEKPPKEIAMMRHAEFKEALADEQRRVAESKGELY